MRILFTGGGGAASGAWRQLLTCVMFVDASEPLATAGQWYVPRGDKPGFVPALLEVCRWQIPDLLVPGVDEELIPIAEARASFPCPVLLPDVRIIERHLDKLVSELWLRRAGISTPRTMSLAEFMLQRVSRNHPTPLGYPVFMKPRRGRGSRHAHVVASRDDMRYRVSEMGLSSKTVKTLVVVQDVLHGQEYTVTVVADQAKRLRAIVPVRVEDKQGVTLRGSTDADPVVIDVCRRIHQAEPFSGVINVQGMKTEDGRFLPFEINPRVSTTTCLAVAAGVDVFALAMEPELAPFKAMSLRRSWHTEFVS